MSNNKYAWIYNPEQNNFYLGKGLIPIKFGYGSTHAYLMYVKDDVYEKIFSEWCTRKK